ncbi:ead/Ea22-like family protein [Enterobacter ludwigii]|uniref:ead/Ea22-like family protein n=1 Tax=Enterobacter ludwigii TaxID=299767 RepID=UPI0021AB1519|nr:ead/Ea22-like family protein [Enterobacter ludwigii]
MSNIDKQALKPVGKFAFESVGARWHHLKHGEAQITLPKLPLMRLYAEDDVQALLDELEAAKKRIAELEARTVTLPAQKYCPSEYAGSVLWGETEVWNQAISECAKAIRAAGIGKGE